MNLSMKIVIVLALGAAVVGVVGMKRSSAQPPPVSNMAAAGAANPTSVTEATAPLPKLVDLGAGKCVPCKAMAPILDELRETFAGQFDVQFIDVWQDRAAGDAYDINIIPTQIFFDAEGQELFRHEGFYSRQDILAKWETLGYTFQPRTVGNSGGDSGGGS